jgi:VanZ family protein
MTTLAMQDDSPVFKRRWIWPLALAGLVIAASSRSEIASPPLPNIDKVAHFLVYGLLGTLVFRAFRRKHLTHRLPLALLSIALVSAFGVSDEWHQSFTPGRSVEMADWIADTFGAALAIILYSAWAQYRRWLEMPVFFRRNQRIENAPPVATVSSL